MKSSVDQKIIRKALLSAARKMNDSGINQGTSGNLSVRISGGMLITPSSVPYKDMVEDDLIALDFSGKLLKTYTGGKLLKPSSEWQLHADILSNRADVDVVLHCHSIYATALACHKRSIPSFHYMIAVAGGDDIKCANYATFGTSELSRNAVKALKGRKACLLEHHGQVSLGKTPIDALNLAIEVETLAHIYLVSCQLGCPPELGSVEMQNVLSKFTLLNYKKDN